MMAVIIPMAKMPNNCEECDLKGLCPNYWTKIREEYTRPSWCQLDDLDATTFCGVPMEEAVEIMQMYRRGELVHFKNYAIKTEPQALHIDKPRGYTLKADTNDAWKPKTGPQTEHGFSAKAMRSTKLFEAEPQTEYKKWETKPAADLPTENTTCVGVAMALVEDEPQIEIYNGNADKENWQCITIKSIEGEPQMKRRK